LYHPGQAHKLAKERYPAGDGRSSPARRHRRLLGGRENLPAGLKRRNYPAAAIGKILGGNLLGIMRQVLPKSFTHA
jgi:hypothetical protein